MANDDAGAVPDDRQTMKLGSCRVQLSMNPENGQWLVKFGASSECVDTLLKLTESLGPSPRKYLSKHLQGTDEVAKQLVQALKEGPSKEAE
jgi:hypothetical protein